jgi:predicted DNA-binding transcriptional regulator AlpA
MKDASRGRLIVLREAAERAHMHVETLRSLLLAGKGPPAIKRPGSNRWLFWDSEVDAWLESGRVKQTGAAA